MTPTLGFVFATLSLTSCALLLLPLAGVGYWAIRAPKRPVRRGR